MRKSAAEKRRWAFVMVVMLSLPALTMAQEKGTTKKTAPSGVTACGGGITVRVRPAGVAQGSLVLVDVWSKEDLTSVKGDWVGHQIGFWEGSLKSATARSQDHWQGLLGVDLDQAVGTHDLTIFAIKKGSDAVGCGAKVLVRVGHYPTEQLKVDNQFVEPSEEQAARAKEEQARLRAVYDTLTPDKLWSGKFRLPLDGVTSGGNFGRRRVLNGKAGSPHGGVDFPALTGTPVHASQAGKVVIAEPMFFSGNTVVVDHGLGIYTFYCHLSEITVKVGDPVETGAEVGKVGATGRVTGPHLHWALSVNRARVNAMQILTVLGSS